MQNTCIDLFLTWLMRLRVIYMVCERLLNQSQVIFALNTFDSNVQSYLTCFHVNNSWNKTLRLCFFNKDSSLNKCNYYIQISLLLLIIFPHLLTCPIGFFGMVGSSFLTSFHFCLKKFISFVFYIILGGQQLVFFSENNQSPKNIIWRTLWTAVKDDTAPSPSFPGGSGGHHIINLSLPSSQLMFRVVVSYPDGFLYDSSWRYSLSLSLLHPGTLPVYCRFSWIDHMICNGRLSSLSNEIYIFSSEGHANTESYKGIIWHI